jgi:hypothetical protein
MLSRLQRSRRKTLAIGRLTREAARLLRDGKRRIEPWLGAAGYRFFGLAIRRRRGSQGGGLSMTKPARDGRLQTPNWKGT